MAWEIRETWENISKGIANWSFSLLYHTLNRNFTLGVPKSGRGWTITIWLSPLPEPKTGGGGINKFASSRTETEIVLTEESASQNGDGALVQEILYSQKWKRSWIEWGSPVPKNARIARLRKNWIPEFFLSTNRICFLPGMYSGQKSPEWLALLGGGGKRRNKLRNVEGRNRVRIHELSTS